MGLINKINTIFSFKENEVTGAEVWMVYWKTFTYNSMGLRYSDVKKMCKAFLNKQDAIDFKHNLLKALEILQSDVDIDIRIEKQK